mgnify:CR=1 FL=1
MIVVLRVASLVLLVAIAAFVLWVVFVNLFGRENSMLFAGRPSTLGVRNGRLAPPKQTPNSVVSEGVDSSHPAYVAPIPYSGDGAAAMARLGGLLQAMGGVTLVTVAPDYLHAECRSKTMRFVDDFEVRLDAAAGVIQVRSAARLGRRDFDVNRARVEALRRRFSETSAQ